MDLAPDEMACPELRIARMPKRSCIARQEHRIKSGGGERKPSWLERCDPARCALGRQVRESYGAELKDAIAEIRSASAKRSAAARKSSTAAPMPRPRNSAAPARAPASGLAPAPRDTAGAATQEPDRPGAPDNVVAGDGPQRTAPPERRTEETTMSTEKTCGRCGHGLRHDNTKGVCGDAAACRKRSSGTTALPFAAKEPEPAAPVPRNAALPDLAALDLRGLNEDELSAYAAEVNAHLEACMAELDRRVDVLRLTLGQLRKVA